MEELVKHILTIDLFRVTATDLRKLLFSIKKNKLLERSGTINS